VRIEVKGLLGRFDHAIDMDPHFPFVVIHGPNGVGKTKFLELINATFRLKLAEIDEIPFASIDHWFDDESRLTVSKGDDVLHVSPDDAIDRLFSFTPISFTLTSHDGQQHHWRLDPSELDNISPARSMKMRRAQILKWRSMRVHSESWQDFEPLPRSLESLAAVPVDIYREFAPDWLTDFVQDTTIHLIETQRLVSFVRSDTRGREEEGRRNTVVEYAHDLSRQISVVLAQNSRISQQLDGSFPRRVLLSKEPGTDVTDARIRERYQEQNQLREELEQIAVLDDQRDLPLPGEEMAPWQRRVLWIYLEDTEQKLASFKPLLDKITVLRDIVNSRFLNKKLVVDRDAGFRFQNDLGRTLTPEQLSSGEQHELVLVYDLLFKVEEQSIVLIDEPEISLHVSWQQKFLEDIQRIASLANHRFIVATHSPQIIHKWWSRAIPLGAAADIEEYLGD